LVGKKPSKTKDYYFNVLFQHLSLAKLAKKNAFINISEQNAE